MKYIIQINGITEPENPDVYHAVGKYGDKFNIKKVEIEMPETGMDAYAVSLYDNKMKLPKKLMKMMNVDEIDAIVAHEFCHIKYRDFIVNLIILFCLILLAISLAYDYFLDIVEPIILFFSIVVYIIIILIVLNMVLIRQELRADRESAIKTGKPNSLKTALEKMYSGRFQKKGSSDWLLYRFNHPDLKRRIEQLELLKNPKSSPSFIRK